MENSLRTLLDVVFFCGDTVAVFYHTIAHATLSLTRVGVVLGNFQVPAAKEGQRDPAELRGSGVPNVSGKRVDPTIPLNVLFLYSFIDMERTNFLRKRNRGERLDSMNQPVSESKLDIQLRRNVSPKLA